MGRASKLPRAHALRACAAIIVVAALVGAVASARADDIVNWSAIDNNNNRTPPLGWPAGMLPNQVEPTARAMMGAIKRFWDTSIPAVANTTALAATATATTSYITRATDGVANSPPLNFMSETGTCAANSHNNDGGSCVNSTDGNSWVALFPSSEREVDWWGAVGNGVTDDSVPINAAINSFGAGAGRACLLGGHTYATATGIIIGNGTGSAPSSVNNVILSSCGGGTGFGSMSATVLWTGTATAGGVVTVQGPSLGDGVNGITIDGGNLAAIGLNTIESASGNYQNLFVRNYASLGYNLVVNCPTSNPYGGNTENYWQNFQTASNAAAGTSGMVLDGCPGSTTATADASANLNVFENGFLVYGGNSGSFGIGLKEADTNTFNNIEVAPQSTYGGGGVDMLLTAQTGASPLPSYPYGNVFTAWFFSPNGVGGASGTGGNLFVGYQGTPPTIPYLSGQSILGGFFSGAAQSVSCPAGSDTANFTVTNGFVSQC